MCRTLVGILIQISLIKITTGCRNLVGFLRGGGLDKIWSKGEFNRLDKIILSRPPDPHPLLVFHRRRSKVAAASMVLSTDLVMRHCNPAQYCTSFVGLPRHDTKKMECAKPCQQFAKRTLTLGIRKTKRFNPSFIICHKTKDLKRTKSSYHLNYDLRHHSSFFSQPRCGPQIDDSVLQSHPWSRPVLVVHTLRVFDQCCQVVSF